MLFSSITKILLLTAAVTPLAEAQTGRNGKPIPNPLGSRPASGSGQKAKCYIACYTTYCGQVDDVCFILV